jgi:glycosyltransferase involved in cell wall biosynthesis
LNLLHVVPTYLPAWRHGGPIWAVHGLCKALAARGHRVTVFTTDVHGDATLDVPRAEPVALDGVEVWYFPVTFPRRLYHSPEMTVALAARVRGFDLVHLHSVFLAPTSAAARAAERADVPFVVSPRGMLVADLIRRHGRWRKLAWMLLAERRTLERASALHVTSALEAEEAARLGLPLPPAFVVPNGVDPIPEDGGPREPFVLFLGRVSWKKGLDRLIPALAHCPDVVLKIAGNDEEGLRPELESLARDAGVAGRVEFLGAVEGEEKESLLRRAAVLALPSRSENFGNAVLEAMAAGCPVVVTPEVGLADTVREAGAGLVVDGAPEALGPALRDLLADPARRTEMGRRGAEAARESFGWDAVARQMEKLYEIAFSPSPRREGGRPGEGAGG